MMSNKIFNIGIVGAGQLGSRHLQGLAKIDLPCSIEVMDPWDNSLKIADERFRQIPENNNIKSIKYFDAISRMSDHHDLVVIATTADVRLAVVKSLFQVSKVRNIILEKVVFQSEAEFKVADELFKENKVSVWVNCVRRITPAYQEIKKYFVNNPVKAVKVSGGEWWGMGSNSLHFIDCIAYLCGDDEYTLNGANLDENIKESKRSGFMEFTGTLNGHYATGPDFELVCTAGSDLPVKVEINSENYDICVGETEKKYCVTDKKGGSIDEFLFAVPFQSDLTNITAKEIILQAQCNLPTFAESWKLHLPLLRVLNHHLAKVKGIPFSKCPIT